MLLMRQFDGVEKIKTIGSTYMAAAGLRSNAAVRTSVGYFTATLWNKSLGSLLPFLQLQMPGWMGCPMKVTHCCTKTKEKLPHRQTEPSTSSPPIEFNSCSRQQNRLLRTCWFWFSLPARCRNNWGNSVGMPSSNTAWELVRSECKLATSCDSAYTQQQLASGSPWNLFSTWVSTVTCFIGSMLQASTTETWWQEWSAHPSRSTTSGVTPSTFPVGWKPTAFKATFKYAKSLTSQHPMQTFPDNRSFPLRTEILSGQKGNCWSAQGTRHWRKLQRHDPHQRQKRTSSCVSYIIGAKRREFLQLRSSYHFRHSSHKCQTVHRQQHKLTNSRVKLEFSCGKQLQNKVPMSTTTVPNKMGFVSDVKLCLSIGQDSWGNNLANKAVRFQQSVERQWRGQNLAWLLRKDASWTQIASVATRASSSFHSVMSICLCYYMDTPFVNVWSRKHFRVTPKLIKSRGFSEHVVGNFRHWFRWRQMDAFLARSVR